MDVTPHRWDSLEDGTREMYESYRMSLHQQSIARAVPLWHELHPSERQAWSIAFKGTLAKAYRIVADHLTTHIKEDCARNCAELEGDAS